MQQCDDVTAVAFGLGQQSAGCALGSIHLCLLRWYITTPTINSSKSQQASVDLPFNASPFLVTNRYLASICTGWACSGLRGSVLSSGLEKVADMDCSVSFNQYCSKLLRHAGGANNNMSAGKSRG